MILFFLIMSMLWNRRYFTALDLSNGDCYIQVFQLWVSSSSIGKLSYFSNLNKHSSEKFVQIAQTEIFEWIVGYWIEVWNRNNGM